MAVFSRNRGEAVGKKERKKERKRRREGRFY
jgi:hypothetical protein